jgi:acetoin utilization protein AcuB
MSASGEEWRHTQVKGEAMQVKELMSNNPITIRGEETCHEAALRMSRHKIRHLPVVDRRGLLEGIVTDRDLRHHLLSSAMARELGRQPAARLLEKGCVVDVMSSPAFVTTADEELDKAALRMREHHVGALPVVDGRRLIGILTETDLLRRIVDADAEASYEVTGIVVSYP